MSSKHLSDACWTLFHRSATILAYTLDLETVNVRFRAVTVWVMVTVHVIAAV